MKKRAYNLTAVDGLKKEDFPVVDIYRTHSERLGCSSVAILNLIILMGLNGEDDKPSEIVLGFETSLNTKNGVAQSGDIFKVLGDLVEAHELEVLGFDGAKPSLYFLLFLLINDFFFLIKNDSTKGDVGHLDVLWYEPKRRQVFFNAWELTQEDLENLISHEGVFLYGFRDQRQLGRVFISRAELENLTVSLNEEQEIFLTKNEKLLLKKSINDVLLESDLIGRPLREVLEEKLNLLKNLGHLPEITLLAPF